EASEPNAGRGTRRDPPDLHRAAPARCEHATILARGVRVAVPERALAGATAGDAAGGRASGGARPLAARGEPWRRRRATSTTMPTWAWWGAARRSKPPSKPRPGPRSH